MRIVHLHLRGVRELAVNRDDRATFYNVRLPEMSVVAAVAKF